MASPFPSYSLSRLLFLAGLAIGRYTLPRNPDMSAPIVVETDSLGENYASVRLGPNAATASSGRSSGKKSSAALSTEAIIASLRSAMGRPSDRHSYLEASKLIDGIDPKKIRPVIDAFQALPNQREKSIYLSMLVARWAEAEPQTALAFAQTTSHPSSQIARLRRSPFPGRKKIRRPRTPGPCNSPPGQDRDPALQAVISSLAESDPQAALAMLQTLPASGHNQPNFYWPIFSRWASIDPITASVNGRRYCLRDRHDNAVQVVASTWASQDAQAAFAWVNSLPTGQSRDNALQSVLSTWANKDPQEASAICRGVAARPDARPGSREHRAAMGAKRSDRRPRLDPSTAARRRTKSRNPKRPHRVGRKAIRRPRRITSRRLPAGKAQEDAVKSIARQLATADVQTALDWAQKLPAGPTRENALNPIVAQWSETDPASAAEFALRNATGEVRQNLLNSISRQWAQNDPQAALSWAQNLSDPASRNAVLPNIISSVAENDPRRAAQMLSRLSGETQTAAATSVISQWAGERSASGRQLGGLLS